MTWGRFTKLLWDKYVREAQLAGKVREFLSLIKEGWQYVTKFDELARFMPTIVPTDEARKMKFIYGLFLEIAKQTDNDREGPESYLDTVH